MSQKLPKALRNKRNKADSEEANGENSTFKKQRTDESV
jgi:hypothetical protein